jgi:hypothetical protein
MRYRRMPIEVESPEEVGYGAIACNLAESSIADANLDDLRVDLAGLMLRYGDHRGLVQLRELIAADAGRPLPPDAVPLGPDDVLATVGAAGALFIVATALLEPGDEIVERHGQVPQPHVGDAALSEVVADALVAQRLGRLDLDGHPAVAHRPSLRDDSRRSVDSAAREQRGGDHGRQRGGDHRG